MEKTAKTAGIPHALFPVNLATFFHDLRGTLPAATWTSVASLLWEADMTAVLYGMRPMAQDLTQAQRDTLQQVRAAWVSLEHATRPVVYEYLQPTLRALCTGV